MSCCWYARSWYEFEPLFTNINSFKGDTKCNDESDYSIDTLANDIVQIIFAMFPTEAPPIILIGHRQVYLNCCFFLRCLILIVHAFFRFSMGGAVSVHVAQKRAIPSFAGLVVIDVVEGMV